MSIVSEPVTATVHFTGENPPVKVDAYAVGPGMPGTVLHWPEGNEISQVDPLTFSYTFSPPKAGRYWVMMDAFDNQDRVIGSDADFVDVEPKRAHA